MLVELECEICKNKFQVPKARENTAKYCSKECMGIGHRAKNNVTCTMCKKPFHIKNSALNHYKRNFGTYCSRECFANDKKIKFSGEGNHQFGLKGELNSSFKGLKLSRKNNNLIENKIYCPNHPFKDKNGRMLEHRLIVEENYNLFDLNRFVKIDSKYYLSPYFHVHHLNGDHSDNRVENLIIVTKSEHTTLHNKTKQIIRDNKGRITGVLKLGELLENPVEDNQQPSINLND